MAKAKYKKGKDGRWQTKVWDGTYGPDGIKHYIPVYSTKSSGDLEKTVNKMKADVEKPPGPCTAILSTCTSNR